MNKNKEIEEMAKEICVNCKDVTYCSNEKCTMCFYVAEKLYNAGYRNCKDKVVLTKREHEIVMKNQYDVGFRFGYKKMQEENGQLRLENNDLEAENDKLKEELVKASELKAETIKLAKQETAREIISKMKKYRFHKGLLTIEYEMLVNDLAKQYGVEVE